MNLLSLHWDPKDIHHHRACQGPRKNREMAGVDDLVVYMQTAVKYSSLHIHHHIVHTSHFPIFSRPKPGGGVYIYIYGVPL